jgi:hypothetical protein
MNYANQITITNNIVRWVSNDSVPPTDCLQQMVNDGQITTDQMALSLDQRKVEDAKAIAQYIAARKRHGYSTEELFEMRAEFGAGEEVVDIFTGETIKL